MSEQSNSRKPLEKVFLLGAGASVPAGIPAIKKMTTEFLKNKGRERRFTKTFSEIRHLPPSIHILTKVASEHFEKLDLEYLLRLILDLQDPKTRSLFESKHPQIKSITNEDLLEIKDLLESFIREKCENIKTVEYLWPLEQLANREKLYIFTLNYDGAIEIFCEKRGIEYTDGFDPRWNLKKFEDESSQIYLYKLHGSLYWFRTANATAIKVPMKGLGISTMKYLTDETVSEMMIYPTVDKNLKSLIPHTLFQKFIDKLNNSDLCIIIGYSFRDKEIKDCIIDSISQNRNLWLIIINPTASKLVQDIFKDHSDKLPRIMTKDMRIEEAFSNAEFIQRLQMIEHIKRSESDLSEMQNNTTERLDDEWEVILSVYLYEHHYERISWLVETLRSRDFRIIRKDEHSPSSIEEQIGHLSLKFLIKYAKDKKRCEVWKKIFYEYCCALEYYFFHPDEHIIETDDSYDEYRGENIQPFWYTAGYFPRFSEVIKEFSNVLKESSQTKNANLNSKINQLIKTLDFLKSYEGDEWIDFVQEYEEKSLGLQKWARKIIESF